MPQPLRVTPKGVTWAGGPSPPLYKPVRRVDRGPALAPELHGAPARRGRLTMRAVGGRAISERPNGSTF